MIHSRLFPPAAARLAVTVLGLTVAAAPAAAQQVQGGATTELATFFVRGVDTAYDPNTNTYLVVGGQAGVLVGVCLNASGIPITGAFQFNSSGHAQFPRARYSPHVFGSGGFLVTWPQEVGATIEVRARVVNCSGALGGEQVVSGGHSAWLESGAAVAYSTASQRFLVVWKSFPPDIRIKATLVDNNGVRVSDVVNLSSGFGRDPGVAWNPHTNQFGVSFSGEEGDKSPSYSGFSIVPASNVHGAVTRTFNHLFGGLTTISDIDVNPATNRFMMTWFEFPGTLARVAEFDAAGNLLTQGIASGRLGSYDSLSIAYNPVSGTFLLAGIDRANDAILGLELNSRGFPFNGENTLSASHRPSFYNRVSSSTSSRNWNIVFAARMFNGIGSVIATGFASGGGPAGAHGSGGPAPPPPGPAPPPPTGCTTVQPGPNWQCVNGNWIPPSDSPTAPPPPSGGCATAQPGPGWVCVNGNWLPPDTAPAPPPPSSSCSTQSPGAGWVCVNGNWLPPDQAPAPPPPTSSCTTQSPGAGWVCINGNWLPPDLAPAASSCPTQSPGPGWVCINGNWLPPDQAPAAPSTSSCGTQQPAPGWVCLNGNWLPPDSPFIITCTTQSPGPGWVCVNGNWLPPDRAPLSSLTASSCPGAPPAAGWVCVNGNWYPPDHPVVIGG